jgi:hypothetical protein
MTTIAPPVTGITCAVPGFDDSLRNRAVAMKHGAGGRAMRRLIQETLVRGLVDLPVDGIGVSAMDDGAAIRIGNDQWLIVTTDSHVVHPIFFPGGDIGRLSIAGTVNDLAMMGAPEPLGLTCSIILEEGFLLSDLERIQESIVATCREARTPVITGDTKVMGRGEIDGVVLNTAGVAITSRVVRDCALQPGDQIIVTGTIADHGIALMAVRNKLELDGDWGSRGAQGSDARWCGECFARDGREERRRDRDSRSGHPGERECAGRRRDARPGPAAHRQRGESRRRRARRVAGGRASVGSDSVAGWRRKRRDHR